MPSLPLRTLPPPSPLRTSSCCEPLSALDARDRVDAVAVRVLRSGDRQVDADARRRLEVGGDVVSAAAGDRVVAGATLDVVVLRGAHELVVSGFAPEERVVAVACMQVVVAAGAAQVQVLVGRAAGAMTALTAHPVVGGRAEDHDVLHARQRDVGVRRRVCSDVEIDPLRPERDRGALLALPRTSTGPAGRRRGRPRTRSRSRTALRPCSQGRRRRSWRRARPSCHRPRRPRRRRRRRCATVAAPQDTRFTAIVPSALRVIVASSAARAQRDVDGAGCAVVTTRHRGRCCLRRQHERAERRGEARRRAASEPERRALKGSCGAAFTTPAMRAREEHRRRSGGCPPRPRRFSANSAAGCSMVEPGALRQDRKPFPP